MRFKLSYVSFLFIYCCCYVDAQALKSETAIDDSSKDSISDTPEFTDVSPETSSVGLHSETGTESETEFLTENLEDGDPVPETNEKTEEEPSGRLPTHLKPSIYNLILQPFINGNRSIHGQVEIVFKVYKPTDTIVINIADIITLNETCKVSSISGNSSANPVVVSQSYNPELQFYSVKLDRTLIRGQNYRFSVSFIGYLNSKLVGFYLSSYVDSMGVEHKLAATQFSPVDARKAFPCFDEPSFKAVFNIAIRREEKYTARSCMPRKETITLQHLPGWYEDRFGPTLRQSTYIVGFLVSEFEGVTSNALNHTNFTIWARPEALSQTDYSLSLGPKVLTFLEGYFNILYPLPKLDMVAIPDFKFNGMENWGLIKYRESALLFDPTLSTVSSKRSIAQVVSHELAHMWFGNLVTPNWWSDLWLKEGFANYMGYSAVDGVEPEWKMMEYLVTSATQSALESDSLRSTHPVQVEVDRVDRISEIFDAISYQKGASIIRMMFHFLSEQTYKRGMTDYLVGLQYSNAFQDDLWEYLTKAWDESVFGSTDHNMTVKDVMDTWTLNEGYPLVTVTRNGSYINISQIRFLLEGNLDISKFVNSTTNIVEDEISGWWIPVSVNTPMDIEVLTQPKYWLNPDQIEITVENDLPLDKWMVANVKRSGFYRVNYDPMNWLLLTQQLLDDHTKIDPLSRAQILDDAWTLAQTGVLNYSIPLKLSVYMKNEREYTPWVTFLNSFYNVYESAKTSPDLDVFKTFLLGLLIPMYDELGFVDRPDDSYETQSLRILAVRWACRMEHKPCLDTANSLFQEWLLKSDFERDALLSNNVKPTVLCNGISTSTERSWNETFQVYMKSNVQTEKNDILSALGCTKDGKIIERYLDMSLDGKSGIIKQDTAAVFGACSKTVKGRDMSWKLLQKRWREILEYFGSGSSALWRILAAPTSNTYNEEMVREMQDFRDVNAKFLGSARQTMDKSVETAILNTAWKEQKFPELTALIVVYAL